MHKSIPEPPYTIGVIGPGRAGTAMAAYLGTHTDVRIVGCALGSKEHQQRFMRCNPDTQCFATIPALVQACNVIIIAVADGALERVCSAMVEECASQGITLQSRLVMHLSGACAADVLDSAAEAGAVTVACHPIQAISAEAAQSPSQAIATFTPITFSVQGNDSACQWCATVLSALGNTVIPISSDNKALYHAATSVAANLSMALFQSAVMMFEQCGFSQVQARRALAPLIQTNAHSWAEQGMRALTGPVSRQDWTTIEKHIQAITACTAAWDKQRQQHQESLTNEQQHAIDEQQHAQNRAIHRLLPIYTMLTEQLQDLYNPQH